MRFVIGAVVWLLSIGWLVPSYFAITWFYNHERFHVLSQIYKGMDTTVESFPYFDESEKMAEVAFVWGGLVVCIWAAIGTVRLLRRTRKVSI